MFFQKSYNISLLYHVFTFYHTISSFSAEQASNERKEKVRATAAFNIPMQSRNDNFTGCVPNSVKNLSQELHFDGIFSSSHKEQHKILTDSSKDSLYGWLTLNYTITIFLQNSAQPHCETW